MEPFSLFQLFQSLCATPSSQREEPPPQNTTEEKPSEEKDNSPSQDTFLQFLSAHDARAKRTKKP